MDRGRADLDRAARHTKVAAEASKHAARTKDRTLQDSGARNGGEHMDFVERDAEVARPNEELKHCALLRAGRCTPQDDQREAIRIDAKKRAFDRLDQSRKTRRGEM